MTNKTNNKGVFWPYLKESIRATFYYWGSFILFIFITLSFFYIYFIAQPSGFSLPDTPGIKLASLYIGLFILILLPSIIEYPKVSIQTHKKMNMFSFILLIFFLIVSSIYVIYKPDLLKIFPQSSYLIPIITLVIGPIHLLVQKLINFRPSRVKIFVPSKARVFASYQNMNIKSSYYYQPHENEIKNGLPVSIVNKTKESIIFTHIYLEIVHRAFMVPLSAMRRFGRLYSENYEFSYLFHEYPLEKPIIIEPNNTILIYIPESELDIFMHKITKRGEIFARTIHPVYVTIIDSFRMREWTSEKMYFPTFLLYFPHKWE